MKKHWEKEGKGYVALYINQLQVTLEREGKRERRERDGRKGET